MSTDPLSPEQLAEVRAAVGVLQRATAEDWCVAPTTAYAAVTSQGPRSCRVPAIVRSAERLDYTYAKAIASVLNAAPSLLAVAEAAAQLKENQERQRKMFARRDPSDGK